MSQLDCTRLLKAVRDSFSQIAVGAKQRSGAYSVADCLMSGYSLFSLKYPFLLQFDRHFREDIVRHNLSHIYQIKHVPSDTQMRARLDEMDPKPLRKTFRKLLAIAQRSKRLELFQYYEGRYLVPLDGTGYFLRIRIQTDHCFA